MALGRKPNQPGRMFSRAFRAVSTLTLTAIAVLAGLALASLLGNASRHLDRYAVDALQRTLHRQVRVGKVEVLRPGLIRVSGIAVSAGPTFASGTLLRARDVRVRYRLWDVVTGRVDAVGSIVSVDLDRPYLLIVRSADNRINLQDLLPKRKRRPKPTTFRGVVRLHNGTVRFVDYAVRDMPAPQANTLNSINATLDGGGPPLLTVTLSARGNGRAVGAVSGTGSIQPDNGGFGFHIRAESSDAPYWLRYFAKVQALKLHSGTGTATVDVYKPGKGRYTSATVRVDAQNASASLPYLSQPVMDASGTVTIRTGHPLEVGLDARGRTAGIPVRVYGDVFAGKNGRLALRVDADGITMPALLRAVPKAPHPGWLSPRAPARLQALVYGPLRHITTLASVQISRVRLYTAGLDNLTVQARYENRILYLPTIRAMAGGQAVYGSGRFDIPSKTMAVNLMMNGVSTRALGLPRLPLTGRLAGRVAVSGTTAAPRVGARLSITNGRFKGIPFSRMSARLSTRGRIIDISDAVAVVPGTTVQAAGTVSLDGRLALDVRSSRAYLRPLAAAMGYRRVSGTGFFSGRVFGNVSRPRVRGDARIFRASVQGHPIDMAHGTVEWSPGTVRLEQVILARYPTIASLDGTLAQRVDGQVALQLTTSVRSGRIESILADLHADPVATGSLTTTEPIEVTGTLSAPHVRGRMVVADASVRGYPITTASGSFEMAPGLLAVTDVEAVSDVPGAGRATRLTVPSLRLVGRRLISDKPISLANVHLDRFRDLGAPYVRLGGVLSLTAGRVGGTRERPLAGASIAVEQFTLNDVPFSEAGCNVFYDGDSVSVADLRLAREGRRVVDVAHLKWNLNTGYGSTKFRVTKLKLNDIRDVISHSDWLSTKAATPVRTALEHVARQPDDAEFSLGKGPEPTDGPLSVSGSLQNLTAEGTASLTNLVVEGHKVDTAVLRGRLANARADGGRLVAGQVDIPVDGFHAESASMTVDGRLAGRIGGNVDAALDAKNVPLVLARPWLPARFRSTPLDGDLTLSANASGPMLSPDVTASINSRNITVGTRKFPFLVRTGAIMVRNQPDGPVVSAKSIRLTSLNHVIALEGALPFDWGTLAIRNNAPLRVSADVSEQSLDIVKTIFGSGSAAPIESASGSIQAHMDVTGTREKPVWNGTVQVRNGAVKLRALSHTLQNVQASLRFDPQRNGLVVDNLGLDSSAGGSLTVRPGGIFRLVSGPKTTSVMPDLYVNLNGLRLQETRNYLHMGERVSGTLSTPDAPLHIQETAHGPVTAGTIVISNADFLPPNVTAPAISLESALGNLPAFDLTLAVGKNVWVQNGLFQVRMEDRVPLRDRSLRLTGSLLDPRLEGRLTSREGWFTFPTARFRLTDALVQVHYPTVAGARGLTGAGASPILVNANAQSRLVTTVAGRRQPVTVYMHVEGGGTPTAVNHSTGTLSPYRFSLYSSPSLPERQLTSLITREEALQAIAEGGATQDVLRQEALNVLQARVLPEALAGIESRLGAAFGLESLSLDYANLDRSINVTASKRFGRRLVLSFSRPVGGSATSDSYTVASSLQISSRLRLTLQQQKGPFLFGGEANALPTGQSTIRDTQILIEGAKAF